MKNQHIPFELLEDIRAWVNKNAPTSFANDAKAELKKIVELIDGLRSVSLEIPEELLKKRQELEREVNTPNEDQLVLSDLAKKLSSLAKEIKGHIKRAPSHGIKAPSKTLKVTLPDGRIICEKKAVDTFIETLRHMGLDKCADIEEVRHLGHPVVSTVRNKYINRKPGNIREVDGYFIETKTNTSRKAKQIKDYARALGININVHYDD